MREQLEKAEFGFLSEENKAFIAAFDSEMKALGYTAGSIGNGYCWGKYMVVYTKTGVKSKKSYARIYIREEDMVLRLYLSNVDKHREVVERAPAFIREAFTGEFPRCGHCGGKAECVHQKRYTLHGTEYIICDGKAFWFFRPDIAHMEDYKALFTEFYPTRNRKR